MDINNLTQLIFSIGVSWYLLIYFSKEVKNLSDSNKALKNELSKHTKESSISNESMKEMFTEIKSLIKEVTVLVQVTNKNVEIQNELTKTTLKRLDSQLLKDKDNHS